ncbi:MAG TPA: tripartite tricarboxylate transporter substrate binding protein [Candidatus Acidoferrales bacterium]|nr:tripartite tricarboxylate transporter substrate binding protein [Candidatus Acidoferrales bacterium]
MAILFSACLAMMLLISTSQAFEPTKPVEMIVHSAPGGGSDLFGRAMIEMLQKEGLYTRPMQVVNKSGGSGAVAMSYLAGKKGEPHTIGLFTSAVIVASLTQKEAQHTIMDLTPVAHLVLEPSVAAVRADAPYKSMRDFVEAAKKSPGQLKQAGGVVTSVDNMFRLLIQKATGAQWSYINLPSGSERVANLLGGHMDLMLENPDKVAEYVRAGKMRIIAALTEKRLVAFPDVPTIKEQGIDIPILTQSRGVIAPPGIAADAVSYWENLFGRLTKTERWKKYVQENQQETYFLNHKELANFLQEQTKLLRVVLSEAGVKVVR